MTDATTGAPAGKHKIGLALAGGVLEGGFYEVGVLCALEDAIAGLDFTRADVYVGVSSGAVITSLLANGIPPRTLSRAILSLAGSVLAYEIFARRTRPMRFLFGLKPVAG